MRIVGVPPSGGLQPYAPTSVSATAGDGQATISFTAPTWFGKNLVASSYTATSSPGGITGSGVTSGFNVTGLTNGTAYTFTVKTNTSYGVSSVASAASNSVTPVTPSSFESIATATGTGSSGTITFSSIPQTYKTLQLRLNVFGDAAGNAIYLRFNNDSALNYPTHYMFGDGSTATAGGSTAANGTSGMYIGDLGTGVSSTYATVGIVDIIDYASTSKNKTMKNLGGINQNSSGSVDLISGLWLSTSAVNRLDVILSGGNFTTNTTVALYGIKG